MHFALGDMNRGQVFLTEYVQALPPEVLIAGRVKRLPRGGRYEGYSAPYADPHTDPGSRYWDVMPDQNTLYEDEPPNPFGGGGGAYMPGARVPVLDGPTIAKVLGTNRTRADWELDRSHIRNEAAREAAEAAEARRRLRRDLEDYQPNPFGGGGGSYVPGI